MSKQTPEVKIVIDTSNANFAGTNDEVKIVFRKQICIGDRSSPDFRIDLKELPYTLNKNGKDVKAGSTNTYIIRDHNLVDKSYVKKFTIEKKATFIGKVFGGSSVPIPIGFSYSNDWKIKRVRVYYNGELINDTNPTNSESKSFWLDKSNYWFTYPDPNTEVVGPGGICGDQTPIQAVRLNNVFIFEPQGVL
jgi:hypothetical protein